MSSRNMAQFILTTPPGKGAIAVVTLYAEDPAGMTESFFVPKSGKTLKEYAPGAIVYGTIFEEDVVVCPVSANELEIHCHGSAAAVERLKNFLREKGAEEMVPAEWIAEQGGELTENQKRAFQALLGAETFKTAAILWDQVQGAYERDLEARKDTGIWDETAAHLTKPWKIVMVGKPNVGKSSLFNRILGFPRAIVYEKAGTTRDILREKTILDGWKAELIDTAGLHEAQDRIEQEGIRRARLEIESADLILWIREASELLAETRSEKEAAEISRESLAGGSVESSVESSRFSRRERDCRTESEFRFPKGKKLLTVWNKMDLVGGSNASIFETLPENEVGVSALHETNLEAFLKKIVQMLVPSAPPRGTGMRIGQ